MNEYRKPLPLIDTDSKPFWESCKEHVLKVEKCGECGTYRFPPRNICPNCLSTEADWVAVSGKGTIYSYVTMHKSYHPSFDEEVPFNLSLVELEEGIRMWSNVTDCQVDEVYIGMLVELTYEDATEKVTIPKFRPVR